MCKQTLDIMGDHAICCTTNGDLIVRHNRIRDLVDSIAREGHLSPVLEKKGILGESKQSGRRPGDVTIPLWCEGKGLCVDVAVTCPFSKSNLYRDSPAEYCATYLKHRKYDSDFLSTNFDFSALIFETSGAVNREGKEFLAQLFRFAARYSGTHLSVYSGRAWARLSCALQSAVAQSVLNREPDVDQPSTNLFCDDSEESFSSVSIVSHERHATGPGLLPVPESIVPSSIRLVLCDDSEESFSSVSIISCECHVTGPGLLPVPESIVPSSIRLVPLLCFFAFSFWRLPFARHLTFTSLLDSEAVGSNIDFWRLSFVRHFNSSPAVVSGSSTPTTAIPGLAAPFFSCKSFQGPLKFFPCPTSSSDGLRCPRGSFIHAPFCRFHLRSELGLDVDTSTIPGAGRGLFSLISRSKGDHLVDYAGDVISGDECDRRYPKDTLGAYCFRVSSSIVIDSALYRGVGALANGSSWPKTQCLSGPEHPIGHSPS
jgi:hypothetical protein